MGNMFLGLISCRAMPQLSLRSAFHVCPAFHADLRTSGPTRHDRGECTCHSWPLCQPIEAVNLYTEALKVQHQLLLLLTCEVVA